MQRYQKIQKGILPIKSTWTHLQQHGQKPYLSFKVLHSLIKNIKYAVDGGSVLSKTEIRDTI